MKTAIGDLFASKKFLAAIATIIGLVLAQAFGMEISDDTLMQIVGAVGGLYIAAQGAADHGKESTKLALAARDDKPDPTLPSPTP